VSIILELRDRQTHAGAPLVHPDSEHVVLANVFGVIKNLPSDAALNPWLNRITNSAVGPAAPWKFDFWEKQPRPQGVIEGSTEVDLVLESAAAVVFVEVKMGAAPSAGTRSDPERNQLIRNLDVGYVRALRDKKQFALIYVTPEQAQPEIVNRINNQAPVFPGSLNIDPAQIASCLYWSSWAAIGDVVADAYSAGRLDETGQRFALDVMAYLAKKGLWRNTLADAELFYGDKLFRSLQRDGSPFVAYAERQRDSYQGWRSKAWTEEGLRRFLAGLRHDDKALLKILADAGGGLQQRIIMDKLPFLQGRSSASLRALKSHVNAGCKALDCAPILAEGSGSGDFRVHEINPGLGGLRAIVIEEAKRFEIPWHLLDRPVPAREPRQEPATKGGRVITPGKTKAWYVIRGDAGRLIAAFVDAKGACSYRLYAFDTGRFIRKSRADGSFRSVFTSLMRAGVEFSPPYQPDLVATETHGLPAEIVEAAKMVGQHLSPEVR
jgi:hypothetical protein